MERSEVPQIISVEYPYKNNWRRQDAEEFSQQITAPCYVFGFSDGAETAARLASINPHVRAAFIHSINVSNIEIPSRVTLYCYATENDRAPFVYERTIEFHLRQYGPKRMAVLPYEPFSSPATKFELRFMKPLRHQFHNCLECLACDIQGMLKKNGS